LNIRLDLAAVSTPFINATVNSYLKFPDQAKSLWNHVLNDFAPEGTELNYADGQVGTAFDDESSKAFSTAYSAWFFDDLNKKGGNASNYKKITPDKPTAAKTKADKSLEQIKTRAKKRVEAVLKNPLTAIRAVQNIGPDTATQEGKIVKLYPDSEDEMVFDMNRKEDVAKLAKKLEEAEFGSDANTDQSFIEIDNLIESRQEKRKLP
jgi:hypothetical protein